MAQGPVVFRPRADAARLFSATVAGALLWSCSYSNADSLAADTAFLVSLTPYLPNGITWTNFQLAVNVGAQGTADTLGAGGPAVIRDGNRLRMWYTAYNGAVRRIVHCESTDGINWSNFSIALSAGASGLGYDSSQAYSPAVRKEGSVYKMWYGAHNGTNVRTVYAESSDGLTWGNFALAANLGSVGAGVDDLHAFNVDTTLPDRYWYTAVNSTQGYQIVTCSTSDDRTFSNCERSIPPGTQGSLDTFRTSSPMVFRDRWVHKMWYSGSTANFDYDMLYCESALGVSWSNCHPSIRRGSQGSYDSASVTTGTVLVEGRVGRMWYGGYDGVNDRILYAESY